MYNLCPRINAKSINILIMNTNELTKTEQFNKTIQLVRGEFIPTEASDVILALIDEKITFHQKQRIQKWEQNHKNNSEDLDDRIKQLENEKQIAKEFIAQAKNLNSNITINGILEIAIVENKL